MAYSLKLDKILLTTQMNCLDTPILL